MRRRDEVTAWIYGSQSTYLADAGRFELGLLHWEKSFLSRADVPQGGRILIGGIGGGREAFFLGQMGYEVLAFEPSDLIEGARESISDLSRVKLVRASYADLIGAQQADQGPLSVIKSQPFDAIILGSGSLSHVTSVPTPADLLQALRDLQEKAVPVLCSFVSPSSGSKAPLHWWSLRRLVDPFIEPGLQCSLEMGFYRAFDRSDIESLAKGCRFTVGKFGEEVGGYGYAVLLPD